MYQEESKIVDGKPWTIHDEYLLSDMTEKEQTEILTWIKNNIKPRKTPFLNKDSYGIKHLLEHDTGIHMTNNQFKDAMLTCGYYPVSEKELNWCYCISKKSPAFKAYTRPAYWEK